MTITPAPSRPLGPVQLIEDDAGLRELLSRLSSSPLVAVDTEAASFHRYIDRVYLLQLSSREATAVVDPLAVSGLGQLGEMLADPGIVRNRLKVESTVVNAGRVLEVQEELGSLDAYVWSFVGGEPLVGRWRSVSEIPAETELSRALSKDLKKRGFRFVGPTVCYAFMQTVGLVNDHTVDCYRFRELTA